MEHLQHPIEAGWQATDLEDQSIPVKQIHVVGGGTIEPVRNHLALTAPAYGATARRIAELSAEHMPHMDVNLHLTRLAGGSKELTTSEDLRNLAAEIVGDLATKVVFWSPAVTDFLGRVGDVESGDHAERLNSADPTTIDLLPNDKILPMFRKDILNGNRPRKDIFAVGFKTTVNAPPDMQYAIGLKSLKKNSLNLVLANDTVTRRNMIIAPEETFYTETTDRELVLRDLVEMAALRSQLTFTESTVIDGEPVPWESSLVYSALRSVVNHCIERGAYKPFLGVTAGHFAAKLDSHTFLTSRRKTNFNDLEKLGLVKVTTDGNDRVLAYGSKPSVGGQSQRIVFDQHPEEDCIVHFHSPIKPGSEVPSVSQREYECGSHQCGENTAKGLGSFEDGEIKAVYLDNHGPNIVFNHQTDPQKVINFIEGNFDLTAKTGGYIPRD